MKNVYSVVLSTDVIEKIDRLAYENGTNRSNMINQILADYVSYTTPEKRFREIFDHMEEMLGSMPSFKMLEPSDTMFSLRSALAYKYNPTVKYSVELFRGESGGVLGEMRVSMRTQNAGLLLYLMQFYRLWDRIERAYRGETVSSAVDGKYARRLTLTARDGARFGGEIDVGRVIASYLHAFDRAMKSFFYELETPEKASADVETIYRQYLIENPILV